MTRLAFAPVIPLSLLTALAVIALLITLYGIFMRARGTWARGLAFAVLLFALAGPLLVREQRASLPDVAVIVTDRSQSMALGKRSAQAEAARTQIKRLLAAQPDLVVRETSITTTATGENNGTQAFAALNAALADVPQGRIAGAILITDGQVHDAPSPENISLKATLQVLVAGGRSEKDRKLTVLNAARFAIVGQQATMRLRIDDLGSSAETSAVLNIRIDGKPFGNRLVPVGKDTDIRIPVAHEGENLIELSAGQGPAELTMQNNHAVVTVSGVRDRLRVLLVLDQVGKGRVAELMSDQTWLWARGFEGGGPQAELLRRLAHWLMKEPELEAEALAINIIGNHIRITRRTMAKATPPAILTMPSGRQVALPLTRVEPGIWRATTKAGVLGLYRATDGILSAVTAAGPLNPKEVADMRASAEVLQPVAGASGGSVQWLEDGVPEVRRVAPGDTASGAGWIGLRSNGAYRVTALEQQKLLPQWLALLLIVGALLLAWRLEGR